MIVTPYEFTEAFGDGMGYGPPATEEDLSTESPYFSEKELVLDEKERELCFVEEELETLTRPGMRFLFMQEDEPELAAKIEKEHFKKHAKEIFELTGKRDSLLSEISFLRQ